MAANPEPEPAEEPESRPVDASDDAVGSENDDGLEDRKVVVGGAGECAEVESR